MKRSFRALLHDLNIPLCHTVHAYGEAFMINHLLSCYEFDLAYLILLKPAHQILNNHLPTAETDTPVSLVFSNFPPDSAKQVFNIESDWLFNIDWLTLTSAAPPTATPNNTPYSTT